MQMYKCVQLNEISLFGDSSIERTIIASGVLFFLRTSRSDILHFFYCADQDCKEMFLYFLMGPRRRQKEQRYISTWYLWQSTFHKPCIMLPAGYQTSNQFLCYVMSGTCHVSGICHIFTSSIPSIAITKKLISKSKVNFISRWLRWRWERHDIWRIWSRTRQVKETLLKYLSSS